MNNKVQFISIMMKVAFAAAIMCSTAYLLMLGWYNNLLLDDYGFVADVDEFGAYGLMRNAYLFWQCRFSAFYVLGWIMTIWGHAHNLIGYTILLLVLGYGTLYYAIKNITHLTDRWFLLGSSILIVNICIMAYLEISTFYWMCCAVYTLSTYAAIILIVSIYYSQGKLWARWIAVIFTSLYLCGGAENFTPLVIAILGVNYAIKSINDHSFAFWTKSERGMEFASLVILSIGFVAVILGPGTRDRAITDNPTGFMAQFALIPYVKQFIGASAIFFMRLLSRGLYYILLIPIGMLIGERMPEANEKIDKRFVISGIIAFAIIELSIAASVYGMGWYASLRAYCFVSFIMGALAFYWGILIARCRSKLDIPKVLVAVSCLVITSMSLYFYRTEQPLAAEIHQQIETRHQQIIDYKQEEPIEISKVVYPHIPNTYAMLRKLLNTISRKPDAHIAGPNEFLPYERYTLTTNPEDWRNKGVQRYLGVNVEILGWADPNN